MLQKSLLVLTLALLVGCGEEEREGSTSVVATTAAFNAAGAPTIQFEVPDMMCESCSGAVHETLAKQPGAREVTVDLETKLATVAIEKEKFDSDAALAALLDKQFSQAKLVGAEKKDPAPTAPSAPSAPEKDSDS